MTVFSIVFIEFALIYQAQSLCNNNYVQRDACNNAIEGATGCIWSAPHNEGEGYCYPNTDTIVCNELFAIQECGMAAKGCCWEEFSDGFGCTDCSNITINEPETPSPTTSSIGDYCYCEIPEEGEDEVPTPTMAPSPSPTTPPTAPGAKKPKGSKDCSAIYGYGDCCCDRNYGQQSLTFINLDASQRTIESMVWYYDQPSNDPLDIVCSFNCIDYGESAICNISGWDYDAGGNTRRRPPYDSFQTNTWFDINYVDGAFCQSYFHTSCSSDIVDYFDAKDTNVCGIKCTAWTDANPNRANDCNNNQEPCTCDGNATNAASITTSSVPITTLSGTLTTSVCTPTVNPTLSPTETPTKNPTVSVAPTLAPIITTTSSGSSITTSSSSITTSSSPITSSLESTTTLSASITSSFVTGSVTTTATETSSVAITTAISTSSVATTTTTAGTETSPVAITTSISTSSSGINGNIMGGNTNRPQTAETGQQQQAVIIGAAVGGVIVLIIIVVVIVGILFCVKNKRQSKSLKGFVANTTNPTTTTPPADERTGIDFDDPTSNKNVIMMTNNILYKNKQNQQSHIIPM